MTDDNRPGMLRTQPSGRWAGMKSIINRPRWRRTRWRFQELLFHPAVLLSAAVLLLDALGGGHLSSSVYWSVMGLSGRNTAQDYVSASVATEVEFTMRMCRNGVCLTVADWRCGFVNGDDWDVSNCFDRLVRTVPPLTSLDKVRKMCGRLYMQFDPEQFHPTEKECKVEGGTWGVRGTLWSDEQELLQKAMR